MSHDSPAIEVVHNAAAHRFEATVEGQLSVVEYVPKPGRIIFTHTGVPEALEGRGIANQLAHTALEYARAEHLAVVPLCPFIASYIERHHEYQALVQRSGQ